MRRALLLLLPALVACSMNTSGDAGTGSNASSQAAGPITVELKRRAPNGTANAAEGGRGVVTVRASLQAPSPCHVLSGAVARDGQTLTLTVSVRPGAEVCVASIGELAYDATLRGVPAGRYTLRVVHTYPDTGWSTETVLNQPVEVS
jgi:hypothetical protein